MDDVFGGLNGVHLKPDLFPIDIKFYPGINRQ